MKHLLSLSVLTSLLAGCASESNDSEYIPIPYGAASGITNIVLAPCELVRTIPYDITYWAEYSPWASPCALFSFPFHGSFCLVRRVCIGTADLLSFGYAGNFLHNTDCPRWFWLTQWSHSTPYDELSE